MVPYSSLVTTAPQLHVLLVFSPAAPVQRAEVDCLLEKARLVLNPTVRIMRVSEATHPEVVRSFGFTSLPAFVLLQQGVELWRYSGPIDSDELVCQLGNQIEKMSFKNLL
ncbi:thioredoxin family protein [Spirosoma flavum]|uniref:Thioredoxin family protein n=1 Tax=Spirosoma flavum TaxID=2048557 RepID=A0ABW6ADQ0_9BACT